MKLISLPDDVELMKSYKADVAHFWREVTQGLDIWKSGTEILGDETPDTLVNCAQVELLISQCEWATISANKFDPQLRCWTLGSQADYQEIHVELGWGWPELAPYSRHWPEHGSEWLTAVNPDAAESEE